MLDLLLIISTLILLIYFVYVDSRLLKKQKELLSKMKQLEEKFRK